MKIILSLKVNINFSPFLSKQKVELRSGMMRAPPWSILPLKGVPRWETWILNLQKNG
jgi:hypothetical protein